MATMPTDSSRHGSTASSGALLRWALLLAPLCFALLSAEGCSCRTETPQERAAREAAEEAERLEREQEELEAARKRQPVVLAPPIVQPGVYDRPSLIAKPGHWSTLTQPAKANAKDFDGQLTLGVVDRQGRPIVAEGAAWRLTSR